MTTDAPTLYIDGLINPDYLVYEGIPAHMHDGMLRYLNEGTMPGSFLRAVFENDLMRAAARADYENLRALPDYAHLLYRLPPVCFGSASTVESWCKHGGWKGLLAAAAMQGPEQEQSDG